MIMGKRWNQKDQMTFGHHEIMNGRHSRHRNDGMSAHCSAGIDAIENQHVGPGDFIAEIP